jgi:ketosteroid isomerase-like protein
MSKENVDRVRDVYADWARGDMSAGLDMFHPEIAFGAFMPDASEEVVADGREELAAFMREWLAQWSDFRLIGEDFRDADYKVLVAGRQVALGRRSGVEVGLPVFSIWTFRAEEVVRLKFTPSREVALAAAGLTE